MTKDEIDTRTNAARRKLHPENVRAIEICDACTAAGVPDLAGRLITSGAGREEVDAWILAFTPGRRLQ